MKKRYLALLCAGWFLAACDGAPKAVESQSASATAVSAPVMNENTVQTLAGKADKVVFRDVAGHFVDKSNDEAFFPVDTKADDIVLLQHDEARDLTLSAVNAGKVKTDVAKLFAQMKTQLESAKNVLNVKIGLPEDRRLAVAYTHEENALNESCVFQVDKNQDMMAVCASSVQLPLGELDKILENVEIAE